MLHFAVLCLLGISGTSYGQVPSAPTCDNYMTCQSNLNAALNLTNPQPWFYPEEFRSKVEQFYQKQGAQGLRTVCKAFRQFKGCMGSEYSACMTPSYFVTASVSIYQSYQFVSTFNQMHYTCGGGMQIYLNNDACMSQAWDGASGEQLNACRFKFEQGSDKATSSQDAC